MSSETLMVINKKYLINPGINVITDKDAGIDTRIEPRLMHVLCLLIESANEPVSRERLISEVWDNYPGADEGLNQAISFLRKSFSDDKKELIKTISKKGYILNADISLGVQSSQTGTRFRFRYTYFFLMIALVFMVLAVVYYNSSRNTNSEANNPDLFSPDQVPANADVQPGTSNYSDDSVPDSLK